MKQFKTQHSIKLAKKRVQKNKKEQQFIISAKLFFPGRKKTLEKGTVFITRVIKIKDSLLSREAGNFKSSYCNISRKNKARINT